MAERLTDGGVKVLPAPAAGNRITYDAEVKGFGVRVTAASAKAFVLNYRAGGRERRITIGSFPDWTVKAARERAKELKRRIDVGEDPMAERAEERSAKTVGDLCDLFERDFLGTRRASTQEDYRSLMRLYVRPKLGKLKVSALRHSDVASLHRDIAKRAPYRANRLLALLSVLIAVAIKEGWREDNPVKGVEKSPEHRRERYLTTPEIARLADALAAHPEKVSANAIRFLLLTGARRGEALAATWDQIDIDAGAWTKPASNTKQKKTHRVPLSGPARALLAEMRVEAEKMRREGASCPYIFPGRPKTGDAQPQPLTEIKRTWASVCKAAGITGLRLHDLRHSFASVLASSGLSLPVIGALLGHSQASTTHRYAHLVDDALRAATERAGAVIASAGKPGAEVVPITGRRA